jgi:ribosomal-protein-alanine N-acetyltransferase
VQVLESKRLIVRQLEPADAPFIIELLNQPSWIKFIGDKGVRTVPDAENYLEQGPIKMYARLGFGLYLVELKADGAPIGLCGLIKRESLAHVDLGFAFLSRYWGYGYAYESARAVLDYGKEQLGIDQIVAITVPDNHASIKLLRKLGFVHEPRTAPTDAERGIALYVMPPA